MEKKRVLICELHQESDTFNPIVMDLPEFEHTRYAEGADFFARIAPLKCAAQGMREVVEAFGGEAVPGISLYGESGGRISAEVYRLFLSRVADYVRQSGRPDGVFCSMHGATCAVGTDDVCGDFFTRLRAMVGEDAVLSASFDLHGNITEPVLRNLDFVCGYQTYPHMDFYETRRRAATLGMRKLSGEKLSMASVILPVMTPPSGFTTLEGAFRDVVALGHEAVKCGDLADFTVFNVQPWLDVADIGSTVIAVGPDAGKAKAAADRMAALFFERKDEMWPDMMSIDEILDRAEDPAVPKPVILADAADSPNGGAVGDSVAPALRAFERGSQLKLGMFVKDPEAVEEAFRVGVGNSAVFTIGGKFTPGMPGPLKATGRVLSLHDGEFTQEGPANRGLVQQIGRAAVVRIRHMDLLLCGAPHASGDPQLLRHFGIEPTLYDLIVVKANTSFRVPYGKFAGEICFADTPGAGASNLKRLPFTRLPHPFYPFDLPADYQIEKARIRRKP